MPRASNVMPCINHYEIHREPHNMTVSRYKFWAGGKKNSSFFPIFFIFLAELMIHGLIQSGTVISLHKAIKWLFAVSPSIWPSVTN